MALLRGCAQSVLDPGINDAAVRLLTRKGVEVVFAEGDGCCGALVHHMGRREESHAQAKRTIDAWIKQIDEGGLDAIVVTTSGCGTTIKDYGFMFRDDPAYAEKAKRVSALAKDISEYLETLDLGVPAEPPRLTVAYHAACSLQHGQQVKTAPKALLAKAGFEVREPAEGHLCCGSAGTYNMLQPELSARLRDRKVGQHRGDRRRRRRRRQYRLHDPDRQRHDAARSSTPSSFSTGPMAGRGHRGYPRLPFTRMSPPCQIDGGGSEARTSRVRRAAPRLRRATWRKQRNRRPVRRRPGSLRRRNRRHARARRRKVRSPRQ